MIHRYRRLWLLVAAVASLLAVPAGALAAVETDAVLTVHFVDAETLLPVDRAAIHVTARQDGTVIGEFSSETDAAGIAVLINLPRETGEGGAITLDVSGDKSTTFTDDETGCIFSDSWHAARLGVAVDAAEISVDFTAEEQSPASSIQCPPDEVAPSQQVGGVQGTPGATLPATDALEASLDTTSNAPAIVIAIIAVASSILFLVPRHRPGGVRARR